ncbi:hypothetical protein BHM03_00005677 [Ensete ventricosum]|nr:hypothetical protein BHM03_00005677 [Ensete ventricosum]
MLSASGLLYSWRSRAGRSHSDPDPGTDPLSSSSSASAGDAHRRHPHRYRNRRRRFIGRDSSDSPILGPQIEPRRPSSHIHHQTVTVHTYSIPCKLLQERLRGVSLSESRLLEVFQDRADGNDVERAFLECSICLEKFLDGDEMIRLSCGHRFHPACLEPWAKTCGDCPYCRTRI